MTIRRRLTLSFLAILLLFSLNLMIYFWGNSKREATVRELQAAISRQTLLSSIHRALNNVQKEVTLLGNMSAGESSAVSEEDLQRLKGQLDNVAASIGGLRRQSEAEETGLVAAFAKDYAALQQSWLVFYSNYGRDHTRALTELAVKAEPQAQKVVQEELPRLQEFEAQAVQ